METRTVQPGRVAGGTRAPASKSAFQRAIACAVLARGVSKIRGAPLCADARAALGIARDLGAKVRETDGGIEIEGSPRFATVPPREVARSTDESLILSCGESGLCMRMFSPIAALLGLPVILAGSGSLARRPMRMVEAALANLGVNCASDHGLQPLRIQGPLANQRARIDAQGSSQLITGLLIAMPLLGGDSELEIENLVSAGYLDLSIDVCARFGVKIVRHGTRIFTIEGNQHYRATSFEVEGDWSGAAFLMVAAAMRGVPSGLRIWGLDAQSAQPDRVVVDAVRAAGAVVRQRDGILEIGPGELRPFEFDATNCPDIFPPLAALAGTISGISAISGVHRLASKESDRASALISMLENLGVSAEIEGDVMRIHGGGLRGGRVDSLGDHRIAMAAAVAALAADGEVRIDGSECVSKSWPGFFEVLDSIRAV